VIDAVKKYNWGWRNKDHNVNWCSQQDPVRYIGFRLSVRTVPTLETMYMFEDLIFELMIPWYARMVEILRKAYDLAFSRRAIRTQR
jgi:hypothetical protein